MAVGQVSFKDPRKVKKVLVAQRENPIVNRLNKTKVEKKPDLQQEREDRLKELRKRDQASTLERVSLFILCLALSSTQLPGKIVLTKTCRNEKRHASCRSARRRNGKRTTRMMISLRKRTWRSRATRTATRTGRMTSCSRLPICSSRIFRLTAGSFSSTVNAIQPHRPPLPLSRVSITRPRSCVLLPFTSMPYHKETNVVMTSLHASLMLHNLLKIQMGYSKYRARDAPRGPQPVSCTCRRPCDSCQCP